MPTSSGATSKQGVQHAQQRPPEKALAPNLVDDLFAEFTKIWKHEWPKRIHDDMDGARYHWGRALADFEWSVIWDAIEEARNLFEFSPSFHQMRELCFKHRNERQYGKPTTYTSAVRTPILDVKSAQFYCERQSQVIALLKKLYYPNQKWNQEISNELLIILKSHQVSAKQNNPEADDLQILTVIGSEVRSQMKEKML
jgi:hypothetical protein